MVDKVKEALENKKVLEATPQTETATTTPEKPTETPGAPESEDVLKESRNKG